MLTLEDKLEEYRVMKADLATLKAEEMALRVNIVEELSKDAMAKGVHDFSFPGMAVKVKIGLYYKIDKGVLETLSLTEEEAECIRWKPELNQNAYKEAETDTLDDAIIVTNSAPTLTVELVE